MYNNFMCLSNSNTGFNTNSKHLRYSHRLGCNYMIQMKQPYVYQHKMSNKFRFLHNSSKERCTNNTNLKY